eukprot:957872-Prorocentrum_minimum.AAC.6
MWLTRGAALTGGPSTSPPPRGARPLLARKLVMRILLGRFTGTENGNLSTDGLSVYGGGPSSADASLPPSDATLLYTLSALCSVQYPVGGRLECGPNSCKHVASSWEWRERPETGREHPETGREHPETGREDPEMGREDPEIGREDPEMGREDPEIGREAEADSFPPPGGWRLHRARGSRACLRSSGVGPDGYSRCRPSLLLGGRVCQPLGGTVGWVVGADARRREGGADAIGREGGRPPWGLRLRFEGLRVESGRCGLVLLGGALRSLGPGGGCERSGVCGSPKVECGCERSGCGNERSLSVCGSWDCGDS